MDQIIEGILASDNSDQVKTSVVRRVINASTQPEHTSTVAVNILQTCARILLSRPSSFNRDACQRIYVAWARNSRSGLRRYFTASTLERLLDESGSLWVVQQSLSLLRQYREPGGDGYIDLCDRVAGRIAAIVRTHPDFLSVWSLCKLLTAVPECIPADAAPFCVAVVHAVAGFSAPPGARHLAEYVTAVPAAIGQLLDHLWRRNVPPDCDSPLNQTLRAIIDIVSSNDTSLLPSGGCRQPSISLAAIVQYIPVEVVEGVARSATGDDSVSPATMVLAVSRMTAWLSWPATRNIDVWVLAFLHALAAREKFEILIEVCHRMSDQLFENLRYPVVRDSSYAVLSYMLLSFQHSPDVFHKIVGKIPELVRLVSDEQTAEADRFLGQLAELVHCLLQLHPGFPDLYEPLLGTFNKDYTPPSSETIQRRLARSRWAVCERTAAVTATVVSRSETGRTGLLNVGNTCYANSVIQALYMCDSFRKEVLAASVRPHQKLLGQLQRVFAFLTASQRAAYTPVDFLQVSRPSWFSTGCQQDCSEYLKYCLDQLHEQERAAWQAASRSGEHGVSQSGEHTPATLTERTFNGRLLNTYSCLACGHASSHTESFTDIPLAFPTQRDDRDASSRLTVQSLLSHYLQSEQLTDGNRYECARCACLRDATRTPAVIDAPQCLVVTLMRFSFDSTTRSRIKVMRDVRYLPELVLPIQSPDGTTHEVVYTLTSVIVHAGASSDAGHYYTHARRLDDAEWFLFNDSRVTRSSYASFSRVTSLYDKDTAYVLFYTQCGGSSVTRSEPPLRRELQEAVEKDNRQHLQEEQLAARTRALDRQAASQADATKAYYHWRDDNDRGPPGSCGGGGGFHQGSRLVY